MTKPFIFYHPCNVMSRFSTMSLPSEASHYSDTFCGVISDPGLACTPVDAARAFFSTSPAWVERLFALRNHLVRLVGLKTGESVSREDALAAFTCTPGEQMGLFTIFECTPNAVVMGENDRHLNFRVTLALGGTSAEDGMRSLCITTTVQFNNVFGRLYFALVKHFHKPVVKAMLRAVAKTLEAQI